MVLTFPVDESLFQCSHLFLSPWLSQYSIGSLAGAETHGVRLAEQHSWVGNHAAVRLYSKEVGLGRSTGQAVIIDVVQGAGVG